MSSNKKYWKSVEELNDSSIVEALKQNEFSDAIPVEGFLEDKEALEDSSTSRRDFLKYVGFSTAAATLAACEGPVVKSIPYVVQPEQIVPGVANYYATTIADGFDFANVLVKTREGRPIKIESNRLAEANGGANARVHASVLSMYDNTRLKAPQIGGKSVAWSAFDTSLSTKLSSVKGKVVLLTQTFASPSTDRLIAEYAAKNTNVSHVVYDAVSSTEALDAYKQVFGVRALANYDFSKAATIVSVGADFLGDWQGGGYDAGYAKGRIPVNGKMSRHVQFEANMTLSGASADARVPAAPFEQKQILAAIYSHITGANASVKLSERLAKAAKDAALELQKSGSNAVFVTGIQDKDAQVIALAINNKLKSKVLDTARPRLTSQGDANKVASLIADMNAGKVGAIMIAGVNPVYTLSNSKAFVEGLKKVGVTVSFASNNDDTAALCEFVATTPHYLESWGDVQMNKGVYSLVQPTIRPLFDTRQFQDTLLKLIGASVSYEKYIKNTWKSSVLGSSSFNQALHDGVFVTSVSSSVEVEESVEGEEDLNAEEPVVTNSYAASVVALASAKAKGLELTLYTKTGMGDGQQAGNPWLQEFPDPISRASWDNYLTVSKSDASALGLENENVANGGLNGSYVAVTVSGVTIENVPVLIQPGQAKGSVGLALGYGRKQGLKEEMQVGVNAYAFYQNSINVQDVTITKTEGSHEFACVQLQRTLMGRGDIIKETTLEIFNTKDKQEFNPMPMVSLDHNPVAVTSPEVDLWDEFDRSVGHHFNLSIDLNACTGCGACVIACHAENNVPVVGKAEIRRSRDMHWLRIDRYYSSEDTFEGDNEKKDNFSGLGDSLSGFGSMEDPADNPQVAFQPVMCQHCNHAPCETVCPVAATSHGRQGQNHMAYNRCVGTRYCANNCPYKVRRFNWFLYNKNDEFDYNMNNDLGRMVVNPDVTVRSRGVMEKCSMCIQMTQKTILDAKRDGRVIKDGEFQTACSNACTSGAMVFGDINDKSSKVAESLDGDRMYHLLESVGTKPNVQYQVKVRNTKEA